MNLGQLIDDKNITDTMNSKLKKVEKELKHDVDVFNIVCRALEEKLGLQYQDQDERVYFELDQNDVGPIVDEIIDKLNETYDMFLYVQVWYLNPYTVRIVRKR